MVACGRRSIAGHESEAQPSVRVQIENQFPNAIGNPPDGSPASEWEWDHWLGPAPLVPFNKNREFYRFRWFYNYSGGQLTNYGVHNVDMLRWCLGLL